jgi:hypothetical protein
LLNNLIILFKPIFVFVQRREGGCVEYIIFDVRGQAKEGGMQVL